MSSSPIPQYPNANATMRGLVSTGAQTFAGDKSFSGKVTSLVGSGSNAFEAVTGARWKIGGGSTDYLYSDGAGTIYAAGDFGAANLISCNYMIAQNVRFDAVATSYINLHPGVNELKMGGGYLRLYQTRLWADGGTSARGAFSVTTQSEPTGPNAVGDMYVTSGGVLKICTAAGSPGTWVSVGSQT